MKETTERIGEHFYKRQYQTSKGEWRTQYIANFTDWKGVRRKFPLGSDLKAAKDALKVYEARNVNREDFDADKIKPEPPARGMTVAEWATSYFELEEVKKKRSVGRDRELSKPVCRLLGEKLLTEFCREDLFGYQNARRKEGIVRAGKQVAKKVSDGTIKLELSLLRRMINLARDRGLQTSTVSFRGAIPEANTRERVLSDAEVSRLFPKLPPWLRQLSEVARETALSEGDLIRLTDDMIDRERGVIVPEGGRIKTGVRQVSPLTPRVREILREMAAARRKSKLRNVQGLVFTRDDGKAITKDAIVKTLKRACKEARVKNFTFHDFRHCAKTAWAQRGIGAEAAMLAAGHKSVQMHQRYVHLQSQDIAKAFGTVENCSRAVPTEKPGKAARGVSG